MKLALRLSIPRSSSSNVPAELGCAPEVWNLRIFGWVFTKAGRVSKEKEAIAMMGSSSPSWFGNGSTRSRRSKMEPFEAVKLPPGRIDRLFDPADRKLPVGVQTDGLTELSLSCSLSGVESPSSKAGVEVEVHVDGESAIQRLSWPSVIIGSLLWY